MPLFHRQRVPGSTRRPRALATSSPRWRRVRAQQLARHPACSACPRMATEVDHADNDSLNCRPSNLVSYCKSCHSRKTFRQDGIGSPTASQD